MAIFSGLDSNRFYFVKMKGPFCMELAKETVTDEREKDREKKSNEIFLENESANKEEQIEKTKVCTCETMKKE